MPPEPSPPPPPLPPPPEPSPPPPEPSLPPGGHNHPVQQHTFPAVDMLMPYQIAVEEPMLAVQVLVSMSSLTAMLFLSLVTWQVLVNRTTARRCGFIHSFTAPAFPSKHLGLGRWGPIAEARPVLQAIGTIPGGRRREEAEESEPILGAASSLPPPSGGIVSGVRIDRDDEAEHGGPPGPDPLAQEVREFALRLGAVEERLASSRQETV